MCANFTEKDEGKSVIDADGDEVGIVSDVEHGTAYVDPDPDLTDTVKSQLGWGEADEETYALQEDNVETITDEEIRLERR